MKQLTGGSLRTMWQEPLFPFLFFLMIAPLFPEYYGAPILVIITLVFLLLRHNFSFFKIPIPLTGQFIGFYITAMTVGLLYSHNLGSTAITTFIWWLMFFLYLALTRLLQSRDRLENALYILAICAGILGLIAIVQHLLGAYTDLKVNMQFYAELDAFLKEVTGFPFNLRNHGSRSSATFANPNVLAEFFVMVLPFILYYSLRARSRLRLCVTRACLVLAVFGLFFTYSRGAYIAGLLIAAVYIVYHLRSYKTMIFICVAALMLVPYSVTYRFLSVSQAGNVMSDILENEGNISFEDGISDDLSEEITGDHGNDTYVERLDVLFMGLSVFTEHPVLGIGSGMFTSWDEFLKHDIDVPHAHNLIVQVLMEGGLLSFLLLLGAGVTVFGKACLMIRRKEGDPLFGISMLAFVIGFVALGMFDFPLLSPKLIAAFMTVLALCDSGFSLNIPHTHFSFFQKISEKVRCFSHGSH